MHELAIVESLIEQVRAEVEASGHGGRVLRLELVIGHLSGVSADSVQFAFELLSAETALAGCELCISQPKAVCCCGACGARSEINQLAAACPQCGSSRITIDGGQELLLQSIELEGD